MTKNGNLVCEGGCPSQKRTKDMIAMAEEYQKIHGPSTPGIVSAKIVLAQHCQALESMYSKAADEADVMARRIEI